MTPPPVQAVFDAMIFVQTVVSPAGPAAACFAEADAGRVVFYVSDRVLLEVGDVINRPTFRARFPILDDDRAYAFLQQVRAVARRIDVPPHAFHLPRDPKDEPYVNLAVAAGVEFLVTRDRHLGYLMAEDRPECLEFRRRFPALEIVDPVTFLREVRSRGDRSLRGSAATPG